MPTASVHRHHLYFKHLGNAQRDTNSKQGEIYPDLDGFAKIYEQKPSKIDYQGSWKKFWGAHTLRSLKLQSIEEGYSGILVNTKKQYAFFKTDQKAEIIEFVESTVASFVNSFLGLFGRPDRIEDKPEEKTRRRQFTPLNTVYDPEIYMTLFQEAPFLKAMGSADPNNLYALSKQFLPSSIQHDGEGMFSTALIIKNKLDNVAYQRVFIDKSHDVDPNSCYLEKKLFKTGEFANGQAQYWWNQSSIYTLRQDYAEEKNNLDLQKVSKDTQPRSKEWKHEVFIHMKNSSEKDVKLYWIDYQGNPRPYEVIRAGATIKRHTFATHPWEARVTDGSGAKMLINGLPTYAADGIFDQPRVEIT